MPPMQIYLRLMLLSNGLRTQAGAPVSPTKNGYYMRLLRTVTGFGNSNGGKMSGWEQ